MFTCLAICIITSHIIKHMCKICDKKISDKKKKRIRARIRALRFNKRALFNKVSDLLTLYYSKTVPDR